MYILNIKYGFHPYFLKTKMFLLNTVKYHTNKISEFYYDYISDVDECISYNGGCAHECTNIQGSVLCSCHEGYELSENMKDCIGKYKII